MNDERLTPEERAVIEAALAWVNVPEYDGEDGQRLALAARRLKEATAPPEPFDLFIHKTSIDDLVSPVAMQALVFNDRPRNPGELWRCTVTPIERVR